MKVYDTSANVQIFFLILCHHILKEIRPVKTYLFKILTHNVQQFNLFL